MFIQESLNVQELCSSELQTFQKPGVLSVNYRNDPKFSDRQVWANSADPDQTAPRGAV